jgi:N-terminal domain of anti-restriction factor ArdC
MKARRQPTTEQKAKAAERRERFRALAKQVAEMTDDERAALVMKVGAIVTCEGRALSVHNTCLVLNQLPTASMVGGFRQWKDKGRSVRKGEHGLMIWIPTSKGEKAEEAPAPTPADGAEDAPKRAGFVMGTVFDVSQTDESQDRDRIDRPRMDELAQDMADVGSL